MIAPPLFSVDLQKAQLVERVLRRGGIAEADKKRVADVESAALRQNFSSLDAALPAQLQSRVIFHSLPSKTKIKRITTTSPSPPPP